jgi:hypothetical protein
MKEVWDIIKANFSDNEILVVNLINDLLMMIMNKISYSGIED